jgi:hypothetical protein
VISGAANIAASAAQAAILSSSFWISARSPRDALREDSACSTSLAAEPSKTRSSRSVTSCFCVVSSEKAAAYTWVRAVSSRVTSPFSVMICSSLRTVV